MRNSFNRTFISVVLVVEGLADELHYFCGAEAEGPHPLDELVG